MNGNIVGFGYDSYEYGMGAATYGQPNTFGEPLNSECNHKLIFVPYWVRQTLERNKLDYIDVLKYDKLREVLSAEDTAAFLAVNEEFDFEPYASLMLPSYIGWAMISGVTERNRLEYENVILKLSESQQIRESVKNRLLAEAPKDAVKSLSCGKLYRFQIISNDIVLCFIEQGLCRDLENRSQAKEMVSDYLKVLYSMYPISTVSRFTSFESYLKLL